MLNNTEKGLNIGWLVLLTLPAVASAYSCLVSARGIAGVLLGVLSVALIFGALIFFVPRHASSAPADFMQKSIPFLLLGYIPSVIGHWQGGLGAVVLAVPVLAYLFFAVNGRIHDWARAH